MKKKQEFFFLSFLCILSLIYFSWDMGSWRFSFVGDEWPFYTFARDILHNNFLVDPFSLQGVYGEHRVMGSIWQAFIMKIFGESHWSWRLSNVLLIIPITFFYYYWIKLHFNTMTAVYSTMVLNTSFYLANFFKIGYLNPIALALFVICLFFGARLYYKREIQDFMLFGAALGISFYVYIGPLFVLITGLYPLFLVLENQRKLYYKSILILVLVFILFLLPGLFGGSDTFQGGLSKTVLHREFDSNKQVITNIFHNFLLFYKNYDYLYNHFVVGAYVDKITQVFVAIGTILCIVWIKKKSVCITVLLYIATAVVIGVTSPYAYAPTTRGIFFLPFGFLFAGIAFAAGAKKYSYGKYIGVVLIACIYVLNIYKSQVGVFQEVEYHATALVLKEIQEIAKQPTKPGVVLLLPRNSTYNYYDILFLKKEYSLIVPSFTMLYHDQVRCDILENKYVLIFNRDAFLQPFLTSLACDEMYSLRILSPAYGY